MKEIRRHFRFSGRVQGVGFRYSAKYIAGSLGLTGWVRNEWDNTVTMEVQGREAEIDELVRRLQSGNFIRIDYISGTDIPLREEYSFQVK